MQCVSSHAPWLGVVLKRLQSSLDQIQRLEEQRGAGAAERAAHEGLESRMSLRTAARRRGRGGGNDMRGGHEWTEIWWIENHTGGTRTNRIYRN